MAVHRLWSARRKRNRVRVNPPYAVRLLSGRGIGQCVSMGYIRVTLPGDSITTFLDITTTQTAPSSAGEKGPEVVQRGEALAKISDGITSMDGLVEGTELSKEAAKDAVQWLSDKGLVNTQSVGGGIEFDLTPTAKVALR